MSCSSSGSGCSSAPAAASSAAYRRPGEEDTNKYTLGQIAFCCLLATVPIWSMFLIGIVAGLAMYINDLVSMPQPTPTPQSTSSALIDASENSSLSLIDASENSSPTTRDESSVVGVVE